MPLLFKFWFYFFIFISIDLIFEFFVGHNLFGFSSSMPARLVGLLKDELKIGNFYYGFILIILTYFYYNIIIFKLNIYFTSYIYCLILIFVRVFLQTK